MKRNHHSLIFYFVITFVIFASGKKSNDLFEGLQSEADEFYEFLEERAAQDSNKNNINNVDDDDDGGGGGVMDVDNKNLHQNTLLAAGYKHRRDLPSSSDEREMNNNDVVYQVSSGGVAANPTATAADDDDDDFDGHANDVRYSFLGNLQARDVNNPSQQQQQQPQQQQEQTATSSKPTTDTFNGKLIPMFYSLRLNRKFIVLFAHCMRLLFVYDFVALLFSIFRFPFLHSIHFTRQKPQSTTKLTVIYRRRS